MSAPRTRSSRAAGRVFAVAAVLIAALALRIAGIRWGLPNSQHLFSYHPDEVFLLAPSIGFAQGDWNPHFFNYGTLYIYLVGIPATVLKAAPSPEQFPDGMRHLHLLGRLITALLGAASVLLLYLAVRREGWGFAAVSAGLLAFLPLHVVNSHYATVDVPATFFLVAAFWLALRGAHEPSAGAGALAGAAVGLAAATKYNAALFLVPVALAPLLAPPRAWRWSWLGGAAAGAAAGFVIGCPYFWTAEFADGFLFELRHARIGGTLAFVNSGSGWGYHLWHGLPVGLGYPLLAAVAVGVVAAIRLPSRAARLSLVWSAFYLAVIGFGKERFIRYLVPLAPFLAVLASSGILWLARTPRRPPFRVAGAAFGAVVILLTALYTAGRVSVVDGADPRDLAWEAWRGGRGMVAAGTSRPVRAGLVQAPWYFHPPVSPVNGGPVSRRWFEAWNQAQAVPVAVTGWDPAALAASRPDVFFLSDLESQDLLRLGSRDARAFVDALSRFYREREEYARPRSPFDWLAPDRQWAPPDWLYTSPRITAYYGWRR